jgi:uncharacterized protein
VVKVRVVEVDAKRKRIALSMRRDEGATAGAGRMSASPQPGGANRGAGRGPTTASPPAKGKPQQQSGGMGAFGAALTEAMRRK